MHTQTVARTWQERVLCFFLRWVGGVSLLALVAVFMPYSWMDTIHQALGMGTLPAVPIVGYLARSLSLFYALMAVGLAMIFGVLKVVNRILSLAVAGLGAYLVFMPFLPNAQLLVGRWQDHTHGFHYASALARAAYSSAGRI